MLLINDEQLQALRDRLAYTEQRQQCLDEIQRMIEIKQTLLWRADTAQACCGWAPVVRFTYEVQLLEAVLEALQGGQPEQATTLLEEYRVYLNSLP
jgi:hypothetical protein